MWFESLLQARRNLEKMRNGDTDDRAPLLPKQGEDGGESHRFHEGSKFTAVSNLSTTIIGAGIMYLPAAMKVLGLVPGIMMLIFVAFLTEASIKMLVRFSNEAHAESYGNIAGAAYGPTGKYLLEIVVVLNNMGVLMGFMIILGDVLSGTSSGGVHHSGLLDGWFGVHWWNCRAFVIPMTLAGLVRFSSYENMDSLKASSSLSLGLAMVFVGSAAVICILKFSKGSIAKLRLFPRLTDMPSFWNLFTVVPTFITAYVCHYNVHTICNELVDQSEFPKIVQMSLSVCSLIYIATSCFALLLFGDSTLDDVLSNFHSNLGIRFGSFFGDIVQISYAGHLVFLFPIVFFALRINLDDLLLSTPTWPMKYRRFALTVLLLFLIYFATIFKTNYWKVLVTTATVCIGYIGPALITLKNVPGTASRCDKILSVTMMVLAVITIGSAVYSMCIVSSVSMALSSIYLMYFSA